MRRVGIVFCFLLLVLDPSLARVGEATRVGASADPALVETGYKVLVPQIAPKQEEVEATHKVGAASRISAMLHTQLSTRVADGSDDVMKVAGPILLVLGLLSILGGASSEDKETQSSSSSGGSSSITSGGYLTYEGNTEGQQDIPTEAYVIGGVILLLLGLFYMFGKKTKHTKHARAAISHKLDTVSKHVVRDHLPSHAKRVVESSTVRTALDSRVMKPFTEKYPGDQKVHTATTDPVAALKGILEPVAHQRLVDLVAAQNSRETSYPGIPESVTSYLWEDTHGSSRRIQIPKYSDHDPTSFEGIALTNRRPLVFVHTVVKAPPVAPPSPPAQNNRFQDIFSEEAWIVSYVSNPNKEMCVDYTCSDYQLLQYGMTGITTKPKWIIQQKVVNDQTNAIQDWITKAQNHEGKKEELVALQKNALETTDRKFTLDLNKAGQKDDEDMCAMLWHAPNGWNTRFMAEALGLAVVKIVSNIKEKGGGEQENYIGFQLSDSLQDQSKWNFLQQECDRKKAATRRDIFDPLFAQLGPQ